MITELTKAIIAKHGPFMITIDKQGRFGISNDEPKYLRYRYWSFTLGSCLIRMLAEDKK